MALNAQTSAARRATVIRMAIDGLVAFRRQREEILRVDAWIKGRQLELGTPLDIAQGGNAEGWPYMPNRQVNQNGEYRDLASRAPAPWGRLIVSSLAQTVYMESVRIEGQGEKEVLDAQRVLNENNWEARQLPMTRATIGHGIAYVKAIPAASPLDGGPSAAVRAISGARMAAFYDELGDEWPSYAIEVEDFTVEIDGKDMTAVTLIDATGQHFLWFEGDIMSGGEDPAEWQWASFEPFGIPGLDVCPVVRFTNDVDLEDQAMGEIAPVIPLLRRIDQDTFDRLIVQRFGAWKIRYIAGMTEPDTDAQKRAQAMALSVKDILIAADHDTKFGTLDSTSTKDYIEATDADLRVLSAVTQIPPHHLLGLSSNLQAEALAAAEAGLQRKSIDFKINSSGSYRQLVRLIGTIRGVEKEARAESIDIRFRDTESRSFVQAASALGQLATQLKIPVEMLWSRVPGWTDEDTNRAVRLVEQGGIDQLLAAFEQAQQAQGQNGQGAQGGSSGSQE